MRPFNRILLFVICFFFVDIAIAQKLDVIGEKSLTKEQAQQEWNLVYESLINYHPYPNIYISAADFDNYYRQELESIDDSISYRDMHLKIRRLIVELKCGHTNARPSKAWYDHVSKLDIQLPFSIKQIDGKVYVKNTIDEEFDFQINDEIISINSIPISKIISDMYAIQQRDGITMSLVEAITDRYFRTYFLFLYGAQNENQIKLKSKDGREFVSTIKLTKQKLKKLEPIKSRFQFKVLEETKWSSFEFNNEFGIVYLKINSFGDRKEFKAFYKASFTKIRDLKIDKLILDIRGNGGGYFGNGNRLLTYLTDEPFYFSFHHPKKDIIENEFTKLDFWSKLTRSAFNLIPGKNKISGQKTYGLKYKPSKLVFNGDLHVITDGISFSQTALVAAQLHREGVVFYGAETGGTESGTNAVLSHKLTLPHSGIQVRIPYYRVESNSSVENFGFGVKPEITVIPDVYELNDTVLDTVIEAINRGVY